MEKFRDFLQEELKDPELKAEYDSTSLLANRAGVRAMLLTEYDKEREFELLRREERRETEAEVNERVAKDMLLDKFPLESIKKISKLSEEHIRMLAKSLGVAVL